MKVGLIIPAYNEEDYLVDLLKSVKKLPFALIVVNDGSKDKTAALAQRYIEKNDVVLSHEVNLGKGAALKTGCEYAFSHLGCDAVILLDGDNQHDPAEIPLFIAELKKGKELIFGARNYSAKMPLVRLLGNKFASIMVNVFFHGYIPDILSGYKAFTKKAYKEIAWDSLGYEVEMEIAARALKKKVPFSIIEIRTIYHDADKGMTLLDGLRILQKLVQWKLTL